MSSQLKGLSMQMSTMASYQEIVKSMAGSTAVIARMNENMDVKSIQDVLKQFNKESMKAEMNQDAINTAMDMNMGDVDEQADDIYNGILGEIGLEYVVGQESNAIKGKVHV
mmetsp:Transcript_13060/g.9454  ORF Transcript_13060/g.9454 Transcript_13060/m.9454 type:complete len:111 (+) Transcript_13060:237-569(+)